VTPSPPTQSEPLPARLRAPLEEHLAGLAGERGASPHTLAAYRRDLERFAAAFLDRGRSAWEEVVPDDVALVLAALREEGLAAPSLQRMLSALRGLYRWLRSERRLEGPDPTRVARRSGLWRRLPEVLAPDDARALLDAPSEESWTGLRSRALLALLYGGGLRVSEAVGLELGDLALDGGDPDAPGLLRLRGKGRKERLVPFGGEAAARLRRWLDDGRPRLPAHPEGARRVLLSRSGRPLDRHRAWRLVADAARRAGLGHVHPHVLRHSCATHLLLGGGDLRAVQEFLGHADLGTTERYTHLEVDELQALHRLHHPRG